jgi:ACS family glucarate transporter-like MFS transporter
MPVLFNDLSIDLSLNLVQVGWIWGIFGMSGMITVFLSGILADRLGAKRLLIFACLTIGLSGASRGLANDFTSLLLTTFIFGLFTGIIPANVFKVAATWFPSHQLGLASGILTTGMGVGFTISSMISATLLSPMLGGWRGVLFLYGGISVFISFLWIITGKEQQPTEVMGYDDRPSFREAISHVMHNKNIWLISIASLGYAGCTEGMCGYLPLYLREFKEWLPASADGTLAMFSAVSTLGAIPISMLSDNLGKRKYFMLAIVMAAIIGVGLLSIAEGVIIWFIVILIGIGRDGLVALAAVSNINSKGIGLIYSGTAIGLNQTITRIGPFISPPIGNSMAASGAGFPFIVWAAFGVIALVCFSLTKETGHRQV